MTEHGIRLNQVLVEEFNTLHAAQLQEPGGSDPDKAFKLDANASLSAFYAEVHRLRARGFPRSALCLSGGGIRSASFALGVLHGFAERKLLTRFTYLSTVSGGGYIGGWLSRWRKWERDEEDRKKVPPEPRVSPEALDQFIVDKLEKRSLHRDLGATDDLNTDYREARQVSELRTFSNYLTPKLGVMSSDTWTLVALYVRNLLLNWLIFLPMFIGILLVPYLAIEGLQWSHDLATPGQHRMLICGAAVLLIVALAFSVRGRGGGSKRLRVTEGWYIVWILLPTYVAAMLLSAYAAEPGHGSSTQSNALFGAGIYLVSFVLGFPDLTSRTGSIFKKTTELGARLIWLLASWVVAGAVAGLLIGWGCSIAADLVGTSGKESGYRLLAIFGVGWVAVSLFIADALYLGLTSYWKSSDAEREWMARSSGWFVAMTVGWAGLSATALYGADIAAALNKQIEVSYASWIAGAAGGGIGALIARIGSSAKTAVELTSRSPVKLSNGSLLALGSIIFLATVALVISSWLPGLIEKTAVWIVRREIGPWTITISPVDWILPHASSLTDDKGVATGLLLAAAAGLTMAISRFVNVNRFSAHAMYRNRLGRGFLGSARGNEGLESTTRDPFTDFDRIDNPRMAELPSNGPLFHVVNMALNVVAGNNRAWQERKAEPFVVTPLKAGNEYVNFAKTSEFGSEDGGITLATSMAISGAAASPNQGYHSSPLIGFVMTLFNVRLGWWLGNPGMPNYSKRESPRLGIKQVLSELFGGTTDESKYVYLSDGGHFENLGLYEMVRRRCHFIVVSDGGCDPQCAFEDLGNAVRKIWIDLGIGITFRQIDIQKRGFANKNLYCALGIVKYPEDGAEPGYVLYIKPGFHNDGREPADVTAYALANVAFPHETTADQFFSESQLEAYRALGAYIVRTVLGDGTGGTDVKAPTEALKPYWSHLQGYINQVQRGEAQPDKSKFVFRDQTKRRTWSATSMPRGPT